MRLASTKQDVDAHAKRGHDGVAIGAVDVNLFRRLDHLDREIAPVADQALVDKAIRRNAA